MRTAELAGGSTEIAGGGLLDLSGIGAVVGVPAQAVGGVTLAHGALTGTNKTAIFAEMHC